MDNAVALVQAYLRVNGYTMPTSKTRLWVPDDSGESEARSSRETVEGSRPWFSCLSNGRTEDSAIWAVGGSRPARNVRLA
jgi:hypothetical protein